MTRTLNLRTTVSHEYMHVTIMSNAYRRKVSVDMIEPGVSLCFNAQNNEIIKKSDKVRPTFLRNIFTRFYYILWCCHKIYYSDRHYITFNYFETTAEKLTIFFK